MDWTGAESMKAILKSDLATVSLNMDIYKLWLSALGALFILMLTGLLNFHDVIAQQDTVVHAFFIAAFVAVPLALIFVGMTWTLQLTVYEDEMRMLEQSHTMSPVQFESMFRLNRGRIANKRHAGMMFLLVGGLFSFIALGAITSAACVMIG